MTQTQTQSTTSQLANALADRLEAGASALIQFALGLTDAQWQTRTPHDGRTVGVIVHHVASVYPIEVQLAQTMANGQAITGVTWDDIHTMNAKHATDFANVTRDAAVDLLRTNSAAAATAVRQFTDEQLSRAVTVSLYGGAPLTSQFMLEDHAVRHSYHHLARLRAAV